MPKFYTSINLNKNSLKNAAIDPQPSSAPTSPSVAQIYFDTNGANTNTYNRLIIRNANNDTWLSIPYSGSIKNADINSSAAIDVTKLLTSGTNAVTVSSIGAPTSPVSFNSQAITNVTTLSTSGDITVGGDLNVTGAINETNVNNLNVKDLTIVVAQGSTNKTTSNNAGITVDLGTDGTAKFYYTSANDRFNFDKSVSLSSGLTYKINGTDVLSSTTVLGKTVTTGTQISTKYAGNLTHNGSTTSFTVNHALGTRDVTVQVYETSGGYPTNMVFCDVTITDADNISVIFAVAETSGTVYRVVVTG